MKRHELEELRDSIRALAGKRLFATEIAKKLDIKPAAVRHQLKKMGMPARSRHQVRDRLGKWNSKHAHLREAVLIYFQTHSWEQTAKKFGLKPHELKSLFTVAYRMKDLAHIRKDKRNHSAWTTAQLKFLLQHAGLRPRKWIMEQLGRGKNVCHIKERMQTLGVSSRTLQGITLSQFRQAFNQEPGFYLQTDAGPDGGPKGTLPTRWKIIPWVWLDQELKAKRLKTSREFAILVSARATFQDWIFEGNALRKMEKIVAHAKEGA